MLADMIQEIQRHRADLIRLCERFQVRQFDLFGTASTGNFDPLHSDLDFLVVFASMTPRDHADAYFGLLENLRALFGRPVDLVELDAVNNPYFLEAVTESRISLYAA